MLLERMAVFFGKEKCVGKERGGKTETGEGKEQPRGTDQTQLATTEEEGKKNHFKGSANFPFLFIQLTN